MTSSKHPSQPEVMDGLELGETSARIEHEIEELHSVFYPRQMWASPSATASARILHVLLLLNLLRKSGEVRLQVAQVPHTTLAAGRRLLYRVQARPNAPHVLAYRECDRRRGSAELKDQSWAAYRTLKRKHRSSTPYLENGLLPFCWVAPEERVAITAGNMADDRALALIADLKLKSFGVIGPLVRAEAIAQGWPAFAWTLTTLEFSDSALHALGTLFQREHEELEAALRNLGGLPK